MITSTIVNLIATGTERSLGQPRQLRGHHGQGVMLVRTCRQKLAVVSLFL